MRDGMGETVTWHDFPSRLESTLGEGCSVHNQFNGCYETVLVVGSGPQLADVQTSGGRLRAFLLQTACEMPVQKSSPAFGQYVFAASALKRARQHSIEDINLSFYFLVQLAFS